MDWFSPCEKCCCMGPDGTNWFPHRVVYMLCRRCSLHYRAILNRTLVDEREAPDDAA